MAATRTYKKQALLTGLGDIHVEVMKTVEEPTKPPTYSGEVIQSPSLDKVGVALEIAEKIVYLSNKPHSTFKAVKLATVTIDAGYFPAEFEQEMSGMEKIDEGIYAQSSNPVNKYFRMVVPFTDENGKETFYLFPKCELKPVESNAETQREDINEQLKQFNVNALPLEYESDLEFGNAPYFTMDFSNEAVAKKYDRNKVIDQGFYDKKSLKACEKAGSLPA